MPFLHGCGMTVTNANTWPLSQLGAPSLHGLFSQPRQFFSHEFGFLSRTFCSPATLPSECNDSSFSARLFLTALLEADCYGSQAMLELNSHSKASSHELLLEAAASSPTITTIHSPRSDTMMSEQRKRNTKIHNKWRFY
jgi:hypothetical protein